MSDQPSPTPPNIAPQRPASVTLIAVLNFVFGGMGLAGLFCGGILLALLVPGLMKMTVPVPGGGQVKPFEMLVDELKTIPGVVPLMIVSVTLGAIMNILLIVAGVGLLKLRPWARTLCFVYAGYVILATILSLVHSLMYVNPAMERWNTKLQAQVARGAAPPANPGSAIGGAIGGISSTVFSLIYPVVLLIVLNLPQTKRAFSGVGVGVDVDDAAERGWRDEGRARPGEYPDEGPGRLRSDDDRFKPEG